METTVSTVKRQIEKTENKSQGGSLNILFLVALCTDLITPFLIWKDILPASVRWISHIAIAVMILGCFIRMLVFNHIPRAFWLITAVSLIWAFVAASRGQGIMSTIWGWWLLFQFPFVALFMYLQPVWPARFPQHFRKFVLACLGLEVAVQCIQYILGEIPGDDLAGMFGWHGTGTLIMFVLFANCLFLGHWIHSKHWVGMIVALMLSLVSSVLGEMKLFFVGFLALSGAALVIFAFKNRTVWKLALYLILAISTLYGFFHFYNLFVPDASQTPLQTYIDDPQALIRYLNMEKKYYVNGNYYTNLGRNAALVVGWNSIKTDTMTFFFGWGIGTRSESLSLGTTGIALQQGELGLTPGTGLLIKMQEMGVAGLATLAAFFLWVILRLFSDIRRNPSSDANGLRYAIVLFTCFWPLWLWYNNAWAARAPMLFYWMTLSYTLSEANGFPLRSKINRLAGKSAGLITWKK